MSGRELKIALEFEKEALSGHMDWRVTSFWVVMKPMGRRSVTWEG